MKRFFVSIVIVLALTVSFIIIFQCKKASEAKKTKYPKINCGEFSKDFSDRMDIWENDAVTEYKVNI